MRVLQGVLELRAMAETVAAAVSRLDRTSI
jgi:hypothetical protein